MSTIITERKFYPSKINILFPLSKANFPKKSLRFASDFLSEYNSNKIKRPCSAYEPNSHKKCKSLSCSIDYSNEILKNQPQNNKISAFEAYFDIKNTQIAIPKSEPELCVFPSKSYANPRLSNRILVKKNPEKNVSLDNTKIRFFTIEKPYSNEFIFNNNNRNCKNLFIKENQQKTINKRINRIRPKTSISTQQNSFKNLLISSEKITIYRKAPTIIPPKIYWKNMNFNKNFIPPQTAPILKNRKKYNSTSFDFYKTPKILEIRSPAIQNEFCPFNIQITIKKP